MEYPKVQSPPKNGRRLSMEAIDHLVPRRLAAKFTDDPDGEWNVLSACLIDHSRKTGVEWRLFSGDIVGYRQELNRLGWLIPKLIEAHRRCGIELVQANAATIS